MRGCRMVLAMSACGVRVCGSPMRLNTGVACAWCACLCCAAIMHDPLYGSPLRMPSAGHMRQNCSWSVRLYPGMCPEEGLGIAGIQACAGSNHPIWSSCSVHACQGMPVQDACNKRLPPQSTRPARSVVDGLGGGVPEALVHALNILHRLLRQVYAERADVLLRCGQSHIEGSGVTQAGCPYQSTIACSMTYALSFNTRGSLAPCQQACIYPAR